MLLPLSAFEATTALPAAAVQLTRSRLAARRLHDLTNAGGIDRRRPPVPPVSLEPGARLAVTGPSGAGKTTLLMNLAGLLPDETPSEAAFFAEDAHLFSTTVRDNLLVARGDATDDELRDALRRVGLGGWLDSLPDGLATVLVGGAAAVSAGQRRRLLLARALVSPAPTVLLDEPTEHLDAADGRRILDRTAHSRRSFPRRPDRRRRHPPPARRRWLSHRQPARWRVTSADMSEPDQPETPPPPSAAVPPPPPSTPPPPPSYGAYPGGYPLCPRRTPDTHHRRALPATAWASRRW